MSSRGMKGHRDLRRTPAHAVEAHSGGTDEEDAMTTIPMADVRTPAAFGGVVTAGRFAGHFLAALLGVVFLGGDVRH
jgi:hypothetical protein